MRRLLPIVLVALGTRSVAAQATMRLSLGGTYGSVLVRQDVLGLGYDVTSVRPAAAPTIAAAITLPTGGGYRVIVEGQYGRSALNVTDTTTSAQLGTLATITVVGLFDGALRHGLHWQIGGGRIFYQPSERVGLFQGGGPQAWLLAVGATWTKPLSHDIGFLATARYDLHNFTTATLQANGFQLSQSVHRGGIFAGIERRF